VDLRGIIDLVEGGEVGRHRSKLGSRDHGSGRSDIGNGLGSVDRRRGGRGGIIGFRRVPSRRILLACCPINVTEIHMGMRLNEAEKTQEVLASLEFYPVTREIALYAGDLYREWRQKGRTLALPDLTVAAVAISNGLQLATDNPKDFPMQELRFYPLP
jgi:predicted nucleic acid-binding protein